MELNGVNSGYTDYSGVDKVKKTSTATGTAGAAAKKQSDTAKSTAYSDAAATYESSSSTTAASSAKADNSAIIAQMKADTEKRMQQMQSLVTQMFEKQGIVIGTADDMWKVLASGNFTADEDTITQAKKDISEDGYWGVAQTSDRIFSFAQALTGGDVSKMKSMVSAVEKGFEEATKVWGKDLPDITKDTHAAIMSKFDAWFKENGSDATTAQILGKDNNSSGSSSSSGSSASTADTNA